MRGVTFRFLPERFVLLVGLLALMAGCPGRPPAPAPAPIPAPAPAPEPPPPAPAPAPTPAPFDATAQTLLEAYNAERARRGLKPLVIDPKLQAAAQGHADHMAEVGEMAHQDIGDGDPASRVTSAGYRWRAVGENVAAGYPDVPAVMAGWMSSPGHRANVLGNYTQAGLALARSPGGYRYWWAVDFGTPSVAAGPLPKPFRAGTGYLIPSGPTDPR